MAAGWRQPDLVQEYRVKRFDLPNPNMHAYRLDFAWPQLQIGLEVDGFGHRTYDGAFKDVARDSYLRSQGWFIFRVDDAHEKGADDTLDAQVWRVLEVVAALATDAMHYRRMTALDVA